MEQRSSEVSGSSKNWEIPYKSGGPLKSNFKILELLSLKEKQTLWLGGGNNNGILHTNIQYTQYYKHLQTNIRFF